MIKEGFPLTNVIVGQRDFKNDKKILTKQEIKEQVRRSLKYKDVTDDGGRTIIDQEAFYNMGFDFSEESIQNMTIMQKSIIPVDEAQEYYDNFFVKRANTKVVKRTKSGWVHREFTKGNPNAKGIDLTDFFLRLILKFLENHPDPTFRFIRFKHHSTISHLHKRFPKDSLYGALSESGVFDALSRLERKRKRGKLKSDEFLKEFAKTQNFNFCELDKTAKFHLMYQAKDYLFSDDDLLEQFLMENTEAIFGMRIHKSSNMLIIDFDNHSDGDPVLWNCLIKNGVDSISGVLEISPVLGGFSNKLSGVHLYYNVNYRLYENCKNVYIKNSILSNFYRRSIRMIVEELRKCLEQKNYHNEEIDVPDKVEIYKEIENIVSSFLTTFDSSNELEIKALKETLDGFELPRKLKAIDKKVNKLRNQFIDYNSFLRMFSGYRHVHSLLRALVKLNQNQITLDIRNYAENATIKIPHQSSQYAYGVFVGNLSYKREIVDELNIKEQVRNETRASPFIFCLPTLNSVSNYFSRISEMSHFPVNVIKTLDDVSMAAVKLLPRKHKKNYSSNGKSLKFEFTAETSKPEVYSELCSAYNHFKIEEIRSLAMSILIPKDYSWLESTLERIQKFEKNPQSSYSREYIPDHIFRMKRPELFDLVETFDFDHLTPEQEAICDLLHSRTSQGLTIESEFLNKIWSKYFDFAIRRGCKRSGRIERTFECMTRLICLVAKTQFDPMRRIFIDDIHKFRNEYVSVSDQYTTEVFQTSSSIDRKMIFDFLYQENIFSFYLNNNGKRYSSMYNRHSVMVKVNVRLEKGEILPLKESNYADNLLQLIHQKQIAIDTISKSKNSFEIDSMFSEHVIKTIIDSINIDNHSKEDLSFLDIVSNMILFCSDDCRSSIIRHETERISEDSS